MKIIDKTPFQQENGEIDLFGRLQGTLKYGFNWYPELGAQLTTIAQLQRLIEKGFVLIRNLTLPGTEIIVPIILVLCAVGTYALAGRLFDVWTMVAFGLIGFALRTFGYPMAPLVLGIVLGDLLEKNLRRGLVLSDGDLTPFFTRPISAVLVVTIALIVAFRFEFVRRFARRLRGRPPERAA